MDTVHLTTREAILYATLINVGIGIVLGIIPLLFGYFNKRLGTGVVGFLATVIGGAVLGIFLSIPAAIIFTLLVTRKPKTVDVSVTNNEPIDVLKKENDDQ